MTSSVGSCRWPFFGLAALVILVAACGGDAMPLTVAVDNTAGTGAGEEDSTSDCELVEMDGDQILVIEEDVTARFDVGDSFDKTIMIFGGEAIDFPNAVSSVSIVGLDREDALDIASRYPDFHLCSSPGGQEAQSRINQLDLVPFECATRERLVGALTQYNTNLQTGGDRTSLHLTGNLLSLASATVDATGEDLTSMYAGLNFHLVREAEQLAGHDVIDAAAMGN